MALAPDFCFHFGDLGNDSIEIDALKELKAAYASVLEKNQESAVVPILGLSGVGKTTVCYGLCVEEYAIYFACIYEGLYGKLLDILTNMFSNKGF